ncbi:DUF4402 domain-containing protein [Novosphingobium sp. AAP93]|uniref:DUF4402 domain-containing protein n=1 Tax=Novosphingobium sp. AAP93 TaxID=1523427 RepID=UPI0006B90561|nr:DUF4402 domain-containing protein [Novosphingobium sp. AAP93]KPF89767.1 hypothetical protein IP83_01440 [Novosphingobium sp. AAP93]
MKKTIIAAAFVTAISAGHAYAAANNASATADASSTIIQPVTILKNNDLAFGRIVKPASGSGNVEITNAADSIVASNGAVALSGIATSRAKFTISGEGAQSVSIVVPPTVTMSNGTSTIDVALSGDLGTSTVLSGALGDTGTAALNVGGSFTLPSTTKTGVYTGTFQVDVAYQ